MVAEGNGGGEAFHDEDLAIRASFVRTPGLSSYEQLGTHAQRAGDCPAWRTKALDTIRRSISSTTRFAIRGSRDIHDQLNGSMIEKIFVDSNVLVYAEG